MATEAEVIQVLEQLQAAYPSYKPQSVSAMVDLYVRKLTKFEAKALLAAADAVIESSKWFPSVNELIQAAGKWRPGPNWAEMHRNIQLRAMRDEMISRYHATGEWNEAEWINLASMFEADGMLNGAGAILERVERMRMDVPAIIQVAAL